MSTVYPNGIDSNTTIPQTIDLITPVKADVVNNLRSAVLAIEAELGIDPSREYANVRDRLDFLENFGGARGRIDIYDNGTLVVEKAEKIDFSGCVSVSAGTNYTAEVLIAGAQQKQESFVGIVGQTAFLLSVRPLDHTAVLMFINGIKQQYGHDYVAAGQAVMYSAIDYTIQNGDVIEFWYVINGTMASARQKQESFTATAGQTVYTISFTPMDRTSVQMFINGSKQRYGTDYVVVGTTATYIGTDYTIQAGDDVEFWYIIGGGIVAGNDLTIIDGYTVLSTHVNTLRFVGADIGVSVDTGDAATITFGAPRTLKETLANGNKTDGYNIEISAGDNIVINGPVDIGPAVEIVTTGLNVYGDGYVGENLEVSGWLSVADSVSAIQGRTATTSTLTSGVDYPFAVVSVQDGYSFSLLTMVHIHRDVGTARNLSASRLILFTGHSDIDGYIVSTATVLTGPDALGTEYSSLTITASTTVDSLNNTVALNINQTNDQADSLRAGFTILPMGASNNSKISWNPNNITL